MRKRYAACALVVGLAVTVAVVVVRLSADDPAAVAAPSGSADELAADACARLRLVEQGVRADASGETVLVELARARASARAAAQRDARWVALAGGIAALDEAVRADDPGATAVGLRVARAECG